MKKVTCILMAALMLLSMAACGSSAPEEATGTTAAAETTVPETTAEPTIPTTVPETTAIETVHTHSYTQEEVAATCTEKGYILYTCECGDFSKYETAEALGHDYKDEIINPTETEQGYTKHTCVNCGDTYQDNYTEATGTKETNPPATNPPATNPPATNPPATEPPATNPPATEPPATNPPATEPTATEPPATNPPATNPPATNPPATNPPATNPPATNPPATNPPATEPSHKHEYKSSSVQPTCSEDGYTVHKCDCGYSYRDNIVKALGHDYTDTVIKPTMTEEGYTKHVCNTCGDTYLDNFTDPTDTQNPDAAENNYYLNTGNHAYQEGHLAIKPRYVYWKDGKLIAECFVINGMNKPVNNIRVESLKIYNMNVDIASAGFGELDNVQIEPYSHIVWTFVFSSNHVITPNASLQDIYNSYSIRYQTELDEDDVEPPTTEPPTTEPPTTEPPTTEPPTTEPPATEPVQDDNNYYINNNNNAYDLNCVTIKPRYVYWQNGKLIAECFVLNGYNHAVYNINVKNLTFQNYDGIIAQAGFGALNGATIAPYGYITWTFVFEANHVAAPNADLSSLIYYSETSNSY